MASIGDPLRGNQRKRLFSEWPTWLVLAFCYLGWGLTTWFHDSLGWLGFAVLATYLVALHSSLQHEVLHGHPTRNARLNEALVFPAIGLIFPYRRFRDTHLKHHNDENLTDPYDDPETGYLAERDWMDLSRPLRLLLRANGTFAGRMVFGPALAMWRFYQEDIRAIRKGDRQIAMAWLLHIPACTLTLVWVWGVAGMNPLFYFLLAAYPGASLLMMRTYIEHRADRDVARRTAVVEASPLFGLLYLNNNLHAAHHSKPTLPWYQLPAYYRRERADLLRENGDYLIPGYFSVIRRHLFRRREPLRHPYLRREP